MQDKFKEIIFGKQHQVFKAKVALGASNKLSEQIKTFKVRLDADISDQQGPLRDVHYTVDGTGKNTLYRYILSLKALGFSFRSSSSLVDIENALSGNRNERFLNAFHQSIKDGSLPSLSKFNLTTVYKTLTTEKRKSSGKHPDFSLENIFSHVLFRFGGNPRSDADTEFGKLVMQFSESLSTSLGSWDEFNQRIQSKMLFKVFDDFLQSKEIDTKLRLNEIEVVPMPSGKSTVFYNPLHSLSSKQMALINSDKEGKDYLIHIATYLALQDGRDIEFAKSGQASKCAKEHLTTVNSNALSWLLGKGLEYFKSSTNKQISEDYQCPIEVSSVIKELVKDIPYQHCLGKGYSGFRTTIQGQIDSWISNYFNRLYEIQSVIQKNTLGNVVLPDCLGDSRADYFFNFMPLSFNDTQLILKKNQEALASVEQSLAVLTGAKEAEKGFDVLLSIKSLDSLQESLIALSGILNQLKNRIKQEIEKAEKTGRQSDAEFARSCDFSLSSFNFDRIPQRVVERINIEKDLTSKANDMLGHVKSSFQVLEVVLGKENSSVSPLEMIEKREQGHIARLKNTDARPDAMAKRHLWSFVLKNIRNLSDESKHLASDYLKGLGLFLPPKHKTKKNIHSKLNKFMFNNKGDVYQSLFHRNRNQTYEIDLSIDPYSESLAIIAMLEKNTLSLAGQLAGSQNKEVLIKDWVMLQKLRFNIELNKVPETVSSKLILGTGIQETEGFPVQYKMALEASETVGGDLVKKCLNHFMSLVSRSMSFVFRESFAIKMGFSIDKDLGVIWKAKDKPWKLPATASGNSELMSLSSDGETICQDVLAPDVGEMVLRNYPHELFIPTPFKTNKCINSDDVCFLAEKKGSKALSKSNSIARIVAKSSYKKYFHDAMFRGDASLSRPSFLFEGRVQQSVDVVLDKDGLVKEFKVSASKPDWVSFLAQPIKLHPSALSQGEVLNIFDRAVAIDLGEVGVGYAVFDARTQKVLAQGTKRLPSLAKLPKMVRHGRKNRQARQGYKQIFSTKLVDARKHAVGELKFFIDNLMNEYGAFPIFESSVPSLQSGSKEIELVYKNLMQYYAFSSVQAHQSERESNWLTGSKWQHPYLETVEKVEKNGKFVIKKDRQGNIKYKELNLFPGTVVNPAYTSQVCSCCGVNPLKEIREYFSSSDEKTVFVDANGEFEVNGHRLLVEKRFAFDDLPELESKDLHRRNRRSPWGKKYRAGHYKEGELIKMVRMHMRRPHDNLRSKDTSQSQYHCLNRQCNHHMHADENAAINIGRKWFKQVRVKS